MKLMKIFTRLAAAGFALSVAVTTLPTMTNAAEDGGTPHFPIHKPKQTKWSFAGPFGHWDIGQLQRGLQIYKEVCSACHSMDLVSFRNLKELGYNDAQIKAFASDYEVEDGPNAEGEMYERNAGPSDRFPNPFSNDTEAANSNNGAVPPDFSLIAKARAPERGFPTFIFDVFTLYAENGPDYIYSLLSGYEDTPDGVEIGEGTYYNPYFISANAISMAPPLEVDLIEYNDGTPQTVDQYSKDISAFLMWAAEPSLVERKTLGFKVMLFLALFATLLYFTKKKIFAGLAAVTGASAPAARLVNTTPATAPARTKRAPAKSTTVKRKPTKTTSVRKKPKKKALRAGIDFINDVELIDGVGPTIAKRLQNEGAGTLTAIAKMSATMLDTLAAKVNAKDRHIKEEWQVQAKEMIAGKPPRAKVDQQRVAKLLAKK